MEKSTNNNKLLSYSPKSSMGQTEEKNTDKKPRNKSKSPNFGLERSSPKQKEEHDSQANRTVDNSLLDAKSTVSRAAVSTISKSKKANKKSKTP